jgi:hypothetical protein
MPEADDKSCTESFGSDNGCKGFGSPVLMGRLKVRPIAVSNT